MSARRRRPTAEQLQHDGETLAAIERLRPNRGTESIRREALQDRQLSFKARGVLGYLMSLPNGWHTNARRIAEKGGKETIRTPDGKGYLVKGDGRDAVQACLREMEEQGYLVRAPIRGADGTVLRWLWMFDDDPAGLKVRAADRLAELQAAFAHDPDQVELAYDVPDPVHDDPVDNSAFPQAAPETPQAVQALTSEDVAPPPVSGLSINASAVHGSGGSLERDSLEIPLPPRDELTAGPADVDDSAGSAPASGTPVAPLSGRCTHGTVSCRSCGTNPRAVEAARAATVALTEAERSRRCPWCPPSPNENHRWDPRTHVSLTPYAPCYHDGESNEVFLAKAENARYRPDYGVRDEPEPGPVPPAPRPAPASGRRRPVERTKPVARRFSRGNDDDRQKALEQLAARKATASEAPIRPPVDEPDSPPAPEDPGPALDQMDAPPVPVG